MRLKALDLLADRGHFDGEEVLACEGIGVTPYMPKPLTSGSKAKGRFGKQDFVYLADDDVYRCPAGETLDRRFTSVEHGMNLDVYWTTKFAGCPLKSRCTSGKERRIKRWQHEAVIDAMQERLNHRPDAMRICRATVGHPFGRAGPTFGRKRVHEATDRLNALRQCVQTPAAHLRFGTHKRGLIDDYDVCRTPCACPPPWRRLSWRYRRPRPPRGRNSRRCSARSCARRWRWPVSSMTGPTCLSCPSSGLALRRGSICGTDLAIINSGAWAACASRTTGMTLRNSPATSLRRRAQRCHRARTSAGGAANRLSVDPRGGHTRPDDPEIVRCFPSASPAAIGRSANMVRPLK